MSNKLNHVTISQLLAQLPNYLDWAGYRFTLCFDKERGFIGYYLSQCLSKNKEKKAAFKLGIWYEKKPRLRISSCESNYLFKIPLMNDDDLELFFTLDYFIEYLTKQGLLKQQTLNIESEIIENKTIFLLLNP